MRLELPGMHLVVRDGDEGDLNFVLSSWLRSYWEAGIFPGGNRETYYDSREAYYALHERHIKSALERAWFGVACLGDCPGAIAAWWCIEGETLHYLHVKKIYRRAGITSVLREVPELRAASTASHRTTPGIRVAWLARLRFAPGLFHGVLSPSVATAAA